MTMKSDFVSQLPSGGSRGAPWNPLFCTQREDHGYICELIGSTILSARLVWGFVDTLPINTSLW